MYIDPVLRFKLRSSRFQLDLKARSTSAEIGSSSATLGVFVDVKFHEVSAGFFDFFCVSKGPPFLIFFIHVDTCN